jgi:hypothetical protein
MIEKCISACTPRPRPGLTDDHDHRIELEGGKLIRAAPTSKRAAVNPMSDAGLGENSASPRDTGWVGQGELLLAFCGKIRK